MCYHHLWVKNTTCPIEHWLRLMGDSLALLWLQWVFVHPGCHFDGRFSYVWGWNMLESYLGRLSLVGVTSTCRWCVRTRPVFLIYESNNLHQAIVLLSLFEHRLHPMPVRVVRGWSHSWFLNIGQAHLQLAWHSLTKIKIILDHGHYSVMMSRYICLVTNFHVIPYSIMLFEQPFALTNFLRPLLVHCLLASRKAKCQVPGNANPAYWSES